MKTSMIKALLLVLPLLLPGMVLAQQNIAIVDIRGAIFKSNYSNQQQQKMEASEQFKAAQGKYEELGKALEAMEKDGKNNSLTWSDDQKKKHEQEFKEKFKEFNALGKQLNVTFKQAEQAVLKELNPQVKKILDELVKEKKIDILLKASTVHFVSKAVDLTPELLKRINNTVK